MCVKLFSRFLLWSCVSVRRECYRRATEWQISFFTLRHPLLLLTIILRRRSQTIDDTPVTPHNLDTEACGQKTHSDRTIFLLPTLHPNPRNDPKTFSQNSIPITERDAAQSSYSRASVSPDAADTRVLLQLTLDQKSI